MNKKDGRKLTLEQKELIRKQAVEFVVEQNLTREKAAKLLGVSYYSVKKWVKNYKLKGAECLNNKKHGRPVETIAKLQPWQCATMVKIIIDKTPNQLKLPFFLWNINAVKELIRTKWEIELSSATISRYLKKWGFSPQRPLTKAFKKDDVKVAKFLREEYPLIKKRAKIENAEIQFLDEMGINNNTHSFLRGYSKKGIKPVIINSSKRVSTNMVSTIANNGSLRFMIYQDNMHVKIFIKFLEQLIKSQNDKKIFLILDNLKVHHANRVMKWRKKHINQIEFFFLPPYSPELNPDELLNQDIKANALKHKLIQTSEALTKDLRSYLFILKKNKQKIKNFFLKDSVCYAK